MSPGLALIRTPKRKEDESPIGYLLRVSEVNGFERPVRLLRCFQSCRYDRVIAVEIDERALERALCVPKGELHKLFDAYKRDSSGTTKAKYLCGTAVLAGGMRHMGRPKFCVACVKEYGYIKALWDLDNYTCCHDHGVRGEVQCASCNKAPTWDRPGLLFCRCGGKIYQFDDSVVEIGERTLCALMAEKLGSSIEGIELDESMPIEAMRRLQLPSFQRLLRVFATFGADVKRGKKGKGLPADLANTKAAAAILNEWPRNFHSELDDLMKKGWGLVASGDRRYWLMNRLAPRQRSNEKFSFVRAELQIYSKEHGLRVVRDRADRGIEEGYVTAVSMAKKTGVDIRALRSACKQGKVESKWMMVWGRKVLVVRDKACAWFQDVDQALERRVVGRRLRLSVRLMRRAEELGVLRRSARIARSRGFWSRQDVERIERALKEMVCRAHRTRRFLAVSHVRLVDVLRKSPLDMNYRVHLLDTFLKGKMEAVRTGADFGSVWVQSRIGTTEAAIQWSRKASRRAQC